jgi:hypothetical protein
MSANSFRSGTPTFARPQSFRFSSVATLRTPNVSVPIENEGTIHRRTFIANQTIRNLPGTFQKLQQSMLGRVHACIV